MRRLKRRRGGIKGRNKKRRWGGENDLKESAGTRAGDSSFSLLYYRQIKNSGAPCGKPFLFLHLKADNPHYLEEREPVWRSS